MAKATLKVATATDLHQALKLASSAYLGDVDGVRYLGTSYFFMTADTPIVRTLLDKYNLADTAPTMLEVNGTVRPDHREAPNLSQLVTGKAEADGWVETTRTTIVGRPAFVMAHEVLCALFDIPGVDVPVAVNYDYVRLFTTAFPAVRFFAKDQLKPLVARDVEGALVGLVMPLRIAS